MNRQNRNINVNSGRQKGNNSRENPDYDLLITDKDSALFETFGEFMRGRFDLDEVRNDPSLPAIDKVVKKMISDYSDNRIKRTDDETFIKEIFNGASGEKKIVDEIKNIKLEIGNNNINELTADWVKEWHENKQKNAGKDSKRKEIRDFITSSIKSEKSEPEISLNQKEGKSFKRSLLLRYISLSAAAVIGAFILLRTLLLSSDPEKLFNSYYEPFSAISSVTRGYAANEPNSYQAAVERYKIGDYQTAAIGFSDAILKDTSVIAPRFLMGLTQLALKNNDQAINLLTAIAGRSGEYRKEAGWYLGLAYLSTGEKEKAAECFELLAQSPGFYRERSEKILRRLK